MKSILEKDSCARARMCIFSWVWKSCPCLLGHVVFNVLLCFLILCLKVLFTRECGDRRVLRLFHGYPLLIWWGWEIICTNSIYSYRICCEVVYIYDSYKLLLNLSFKSLSSNLLYLLLLFLTESLFWPGYMYTWLLWVFIYAEYYSLLVHVLKSKVRLLWRIYS